MRASHARHAEKRGDQRRHLGPARHLVQQPSERLFQRLEVPAGQVFLDDALDGEGSAARHLAPALRVVLAVLLFRPQGRRLRPVDQ